MNTILHQEVIELLKVKGPCASIYLALNPVGREGESDPLRIEKAVDDAERQLLMRGFEAAQVKSILLPVRNYPRTPDWRMRGAGTAILAGPDSARFLTFDEPFEPEVWGDDHFHVRPLLPLMVESDRFFVLTVSEKHVQLFAGDSQDLRPLELPGLPKNIDVALQIDGVDGASQTHCAAAGSRGKQAAVHHGHGGKADTAKSNLRDFVRQIAKVVDHHLQQHKEPLILATVSEVLPVWREVSEYPGTHAEFIAGNPDHANRTELHERAVLIARREWDQERTVNVDRLMNAKGTAKAIVGLVQVLPAAAEGRIDSLFVDCRQPIKGRFDRTNGQVNLEPIAEATNLRDLLDDAIRETWAHRGQVIARDAVAGQSVVEGLLRF